MEELISIIIPIYNVEKYIINCIESVIRQTYKNIEIILVNDGSIDNCGKICDEYLMKDDRIKVIHKKNGGLSEARNYGIEAASGKYITFIDSDDYVEKKYIESLYQAIKINNVKISQCNINKVNNKSDIIEKLGYINRNVRSGKEMIEDIYNGHWGENIVAWNKMYSIDLFENIRYPVGKIHEDEYTTYKFLYYTDKVAIVDEYLYNYRQNEDSIIGRKYNIKRLDILEAFEQRLVFLKEKSETNLYNLTLLNYMAIIRECFVSVKKNIENSQDVQEMIIKEYRKKYKEIIRINSIEKIRKIRFSLFYISPILYYNIKLRRERKNSGRK